ncbi:hypothetical protein [Pseudobacillus sp. FSL P4-0506]|uniref:hypothetical protein n=1 Tax=Pseudobacillus sp. FSL P4-0506 TaxID=2921576 RepID=UPI00404074BC
MKETEHLVREAGVLPEELYLIVSTHYHSDHEEAIILRQLRLSKNCEEIYLNYWTALV